jgi:hypothetical protein
MENKLTVSDEKIVLTSPDEKYKTLIKPIRDSFLDNIINNVDASIYSPTDVEFNWRERISPINELKKIFTEWAKDWIKNLGDFKYVYVTNGNSESLNDLFSRTTDIAFNSKDYSYYASWHQHTKKSHRCLINPEKTNEMVVSWPGYSNGDDTELKFARECSPEKLHLDCAYLGLTEPPTEPLDAVEFETVSVSFSKTLSIPYNRIGLLFSKKPIAGFEVLSKVFYVNLAGVKLATEIMKKMPVTYWWDTYGGSKLESLCERSFIKPTKCILFAYDTFERRIGISSYWKAEKFFYQYVSIDENTYSGILKEIQAFYESHPIPESYFKIINCYEVLEALPTFKAWCIQNKLPRPLKVAYISTPPNTKQSPHKDDGTQLLALNFPVYNCKDLVTKMWNEDNLSSIKLTTAGTRIPYYRYLVGDEQPAQQYVLGDPVILNIKKVHSVINSSDLPRVSLSFRFERDPWEIVENMKLVK